MKRVLSFILLIMIVTTSFTGCELFEEDENEISLPTVIEEEDTELTAIIYDRESDTDYWEAVIDSFELNNPGITVNPIITKDAAYELRDRILSGNSPDFVYLPSYEESGVTTALVKDRAMLDLSDIEQVISTLLVDGVLENFQCKPYNDGKLYSAPMFFETNGLIYNETILKENGWTVPKTWDDFISLAEKCEDKDYSVFSYAGAEPDDFVDLFITAIYSQVDSDTVKNISNYNEESWGIDSVKEFVNKLVSIKKLVLSGSSTKTKDDIIESFKSGKVLFISANSSLYSELSDDKELKIDIGFASYPSLINDGNVSSISLSEMYIPVESKNVAAAKKFLIYQYSDEALTIAAEKIGESAPVKKLKELTLQNGLDEITYKVYSTIESDICVPCFSSKNAENESLEDEFCSLCVDVFKGDVEPDKFQEKMIDLIKEYNK